MGDREKDIELSVDDLTDVVGGVDIAAVGAGDLAARMPNLTRGVAGAVANGEKDVYVDKLPGHMHVPPKAGLT